MRTDESRTVLACSPAVAGQTHRLRPLKRMCAVVAVAAVLFRGGGFLRAADMAQGNGGAIEFPRWKLGVEGDNMDNGYRIRGVFVGSRAQNLLTPGARYALEPGDWILEVDGNPINPQWTLRQAFENSNGTVDLKIWDDRSGCTREFHEVRLMPNR